MIRLHVLETEKSSLEEKHNEFEALQIVLKEKEDKLLRKSSKKKIDQRKQIQKNLNTNKSVKKIKTYVDDEDKIKYEKER